jgi:DNA-binding IclR family transcriptional regulator
LSNGKYTVPALEKSVAILEHLSTNKQGLSLSDISSALKLPKTSVFSILQTLETKNMIRKNANGSYNLGLKLYSLGMASVSHLDIQSTLVPYMEQLRDETKFTVHLCAYDNGETVCLEKIEGPGIIRFLSYKGERKLMNTTAVGKAIAAYLPEPDLQFVISKGFNRLTANSICTEPAFRENLKQIVQCGYAVDDEEGEIGVRCIGVPIVMDGGRVFGAISLSTLKSNLPMQKLHDYGAILLSVGEKMSRQLGYRGPYPLIG